MAYKIAPDKKKHFFVGIPLGTMLQFLFLYFLPGDFLYATILAFIVLAAICYGFELFSKVTGRGHHDHLDAIAGILGGIIGMGIFWVINVIV